MTEEIRAVFWDTRRHRNDEYDFGALPLEREVALNLRDAFLELTSHYERTSRRQAWRSIIKLAAFLSHPTVRKNLASRRTMLEDFATWLRAQKNLLKTAGSHFNFIYRIVTWLAENFDAVPWRSQILTHHYFGREAECPRNNEVSKDDLMRIAAACKREISQWRDKFNVRELASQDVAAPPTSLSLQQFQNLKTLIRFEEQGIWTQQQIAAAGARGSGGARLRCLAPYRQLTIRSALPFYLYIVISTAGNPEAIADLQIDCIEDHPTDPESVLLSWSKGRATKEQNLPFLRKGRYAIPAVIMDVLTMTAPIRGLALHPEDTVLFITRKGTISTRISTQSWHNALARFRSEHDLPFFTFVDMRSAVASLVKNHHQSTAAASRLLQHKELATSTRYLKSRESLEHSYERVARFQGQLISSVMLSAKESQELTQKRGTFFGTSCADPLEGIASGSRKGEPCLQYLQCATCKNAIVVPDEPRYVARILKAQSALVHLKSTAADTADGPVRFRMVYESILTVIERDILAKVDSAVMALAVEVAKELPELPMVDQ